MPITHQFSNTIADWTGTVTVFNNAGATTTVAASALVNPGDWNQAHQQQYSLGGNTSNSSVVAGTEIMFSGGVNITLVGSTAAGQATIGVVGASTPVLSYFDNQIPGPLTQQDYGQSAGTLFVFPLTPANEVFPANMSVSTMMFDMSCTATSVAFSRTLIIGFYTSVNSTQLTRVYSGSVSFGQTANANMTSSYAGLRWLTMHSSLFDAAPNFTGAVRYWVAMGWRTSSTAQSFSFMGQQLGQSNQRSGFMGVNSVTNASLGQGRFQGFHSVTTTGLPANLAQSDISHILAANSFIPRIIFNNVGTNIG